MAWQAVNNKQKIREIIEYLISRKLEVLVRVSQEKEAFTTKIMKFRHDDPTSKIGKKPELVIEKLIPDKGNSLIQSFPNVVMEFTVNVNQCRCAVKFIGISSEYPHFGFIVSAPESVEVLERRKEERVVYDLPDFVSADLRLPQGAPDAKLYSLNVVDSSLHGLGILLAKKDFEVLKFVKPGDRLRDITFYAPAAVIRVDGTVRHITRVDWGRHKGSYILGIESQEIIESSRQHEH
ncbi:MAG: PilZ domain-containing protein [Deltaproteobacteria bacterium]|nr:PilZ domain-containing protein [Deltaproteobacteria bacterium]